MLKKTALLFLWLTLAVVVRATVDEDAFLYAIRVVETGDYAHARGRHGERGAYQFRRKVWYQYTNTNFDLAYNREVSTTVARWHLSWLQTTLASMGVDPTARNLALAWNAGVGAVQRGAVSYRSRDYASRVVNTMGSVVVTRKQPPVIPVFHISTDEPQQPVVQTVAVSDEKLVTPAPHHLNFGFDDASPRVFFVPKNKVSDQILQIFAANATEVAQKDET